MYLRLLVGSLVLGSIALIQGFMPATAVQATEKPPSRPKWEYKTLRIEARQCAYENEIATALNTAGQEGWELVGYERMVAFPNEANGTPPHSACGDWLRTRPHPSNSRLLSRNNDDEGCTGPAGNVQACAQAPGPCGSHAEVPLADSRPRPARMLPRFQIDVKRDFLICYRIPSMAQQLVSIDGSDGQPFPREPLRGPRNP
jgi:hypothetical protein